MEKLRIAVFLDEKILPELGGAYSYSRQIAEIINEYNFDEKLEIYFFSLNQFILNEFSKKKIIIAFDNKITKLKKGIIKKNWTLLNRILLKFYYYYSGKKSKNYISFKNKIKLKIKNDLDVLVVSEAKKVIIENKIDLIYYPTSLISYDFGVPYIITHWDLGHLTSYAFPELTMNEEFERRQKQIVKSLYKAFAIFVESESSKKELQQHLALNYSKIYNLPLFPGRVVSLKLTNEVQSEILQKWDLKQKHFFFYPAQFWSHKNHYNLINAFNIILQKNPTIKLLLTGSDQGNLSYINDLIAKLSINKNVIITGVVKLEEIFTFYKNAISLVMPTLLGPTNMPLLEAKYLDCPVLCSDIYGHKEQMGSNAIYFNPFSPSDIADKMEEVIGSSNEMNKSSENEEYNYNNIGNLLNSYFLDILPKRKLFGYDCF